MPRSQTAPNPPYVIILASLSVMLITAVKIWQQSSTPPRSSRPTQGQLATNDAAVVPANNPTPTTTPKLPTHRQPQYRAEIRAEVVLAPPVFTAPTNVHVAPAVESTAATTAFAPPSTAPAIDPDSWAPEQAIRPESIQIPLATDAPPMEVLNPIRGMESPPVMVLRPIRSSGEFTAEIATPPRDRVAGHIERKSPISAPPTAVVAPRTPTSLSPIAAPPISPIKIVTHGVSEPTATVAEVEPAKTSTVAGDADEVNAQNGALSLPLPPLPLEPIKSNPAADNLATTDDSSQRAAAGQTSEAFKAEAAPELSELPELEPMTNSDTPDTSNNLANAGIDARSPLPSKEAEESDNIHDAIHAARVAAKAKKTARTKRSRRRLRASDQSDSTVRVSVWPDPVALRAELKQLKALGEQRNLTVSTQWAEQIGDAMDALRSAEALNSADTLPPLRTLRNLVENAPTVNDSRVQSQVMVARYAVQRRLAVWNNMQAAMHPQVAAAIKQTQMAANDETAVTLVRAIRQSVGSGELARGWNQFLRLDDVEGLAMSADSRGSAERATVAASVLDRMHRENFSAAQLNIVQSPAAKQLHVLLRRWTTASMDYSQMLSAIERLESNPSFREGNHLSDMAARLRWSYVPAQVQLSNVFDSHYRNANARMAVTGVMLNRMLPIIRDNNTPVREEILGARVFGNSASWTKIGVALVPDKHRLQMKLIANGNINARTTSVKGPVKIFNRNHSQFQLQKMITCDAQGIHIGKSSTVASARSSLLGLRTEYDGVPLIGSIIRRKANKKISEQENLVRRALERRVANHAETTIDAQLTLKLVEAERRLDEKLIQPLRRLQLDPTTVSLQTTRDRIVYRGRLAANHHLAAYTPRPNALANSFISLQVHESSINNAIERLGIDGRRGDLREMLNEAANRRPTAKFQVPDDVPDGVTLEFADQDAVRVRWHEGKMRITLRIAELSVKNRSWKNFAASAHYQPTYRGLDAELSREGIIQLDSGDRHLPNNVMLRGVFAKIFSKNRNIPLMPDSLTQDRRLADLQVTQFVIRDGWVGVSIGKQPVVARRSGRNLQR